MRIAVFTGGFPEEPFVREQLVRLASRGICIDLYCRESGDRKKDRADAASMANSVNMAFLPVWGWRRAWSKLLLALLVVAWNLMRSPSRTWKCLGYVRTRYGVGCKSIDRLLDLLRFLGITADVLHFEWDFTAAKNLDFIRLTSRPIVVSCRGSGINITPLSKPWLENAYPEVFARAARVHCVSKAIAKAAERYGLDRSKVFVNYPSVDHEFYQPSASDGQRDDPGFTVISSGRLHWVKGFDYGLRAAALLLKRGISFQYLILGDGPMREQLMFLARDMRLGDSVRFTGRVPRDEVRSFLKKGDVFLLPSLAEGVSNSALEAMAMGLPIVTTNVGGMPEVVRDGIDGYVVPSRDYKAMADRLERLLDDAQLRRRMGRSARKRVVENFNIDHQIEQFASLYRDVVRTGGAGARNEGLM